ncbi:DUF6701 domain-containing protein [Vibrio sp. Vb1018]|uniref:DUF6701 domain-containing protein n=1 Tax=Vibrio sp. Vb1018 TaxID=3074636 RepID=UPI002963CB9B|nr:DUF6701 domain-containing protein [Vibrio sp. Vb1018]MDW1822177.1 DUF6701 domain-containing protein [Vibrio sp. Vb1018]
MSDSEMTIRAEGQIILKDNSQVGNSNAPINLSSSGEIKTEVGINTINGNVTADRNITFKQTTVEGDVTSRGEIKTEDGPNTINGNVKAKENITLKKTTVEGDVITSDGEIKLEGDAGTNTIIGNISALKKVEIKKSLVCGRVESTDNEVSLIESKLGDNLGVYALVEAVKSHGKATVKSSTVCGSVNSQSDDYDVNDNDIYCGVDEPDCDYAPAKCPVSNVESICGWELEPEPEPLPDPKQCIDVEAFDQEYDLEQKWATMGYFSGDYYGQDGAEPKPFIHKNRLRITNNVQGQAAVGAYNYIFPSSNNIVEVEFDHFAYDGNRNNTGADGVAIVFSDASVLPSTGAFGGPLGYGVKPDDGGIEGFAGGWIAFGIDEYGNFSNEGSYYQDKNPLDSSPGQNDHSITIRGSGEKKGPGEYIDTSNHRIGTFPEGWFGGYRFIKKNSKVGRLDDESKDEIHRYRMTIDSRAIDGRDAGVYVSIKRASYQGNLKVDVDDRGKLKSDNLNWEDIIDSFNIMQGFAQSTAPSEFRVSVAGSTGLVKNVHEIDNFQICADEFQPLTEGIHHFEFDYSGVGSTCQPSDVILRACMDKDCDTLYPGSITDAEDLQVTLSPSAAHEVANWVQSSPISFKGSTHLQLQGAKAGFVTIGIANTHGVHQFGFEDTRCRINGDELSAEKCKIEFHGNTLSIVAEDVIANKESSDSNYFEFCSSSSATNTTRDIKLSMTYDVAPIEQPSVTLNYKKSDGNSTPVWSSDQTISGPEDDPAYLRDVYFDNNGRAKFKFTYPEVGKVSFNASVEGIEDSKGVGTFVSYPHRLQATASGWCGSKSGCDRGFIAAGKEFTISITAFQYSEDDKGGMPAKNYKEEQMVVSNEVVYPAISAGGKKAELLTDTYQHIASDDAKTSFSQTVSEVGAFKFSISAPEGNVENTSLYLGKSSFLIQPATITLGRFYPKFYKLRGQHWDYAGSQSFNYMNQNFDSMWYEVEVLTGGDAPKSVENYKYFNKEHVASFELSDSLNRFNAQGNLTPSWVDALGSIQRFTLTPPLSGKCNAIEGLCWMKKIAAVGYEDGPYNLYGSRTMASDIKVGVAIEPDPIAVYGDPVLSEQPDIRFGRVNLDDIGGNQGTTLYIPLRVEYWDNNRKRFVQNIDDDGTVIYSVLDGNPETIWPDYKSDCSILLEGNDTVTDGATRELSARQDPNTCNPVGRQQSRLWLQLEGGSNNLPWLKYDWDNDGSEENPSSVVTFGIHRGNDRVIYRGEPGLTGQ